MNENIHVGNFMWTTVFLLYWSFRKIILLIGNSYTSGPFY